MKLGLSIEVPILDSLVVEGPEYSNQISRDVTWNEGGIRELLRQNRCGKEFNVSQVVNHQKYKIDSETCGFMNRQLTKRKRDTIDVQYVGKNSRWWPPNRKYL